MIYFFNHKYENYEKYGKILWKIIPLQKILKHIPEIHNIDWYNIKMFKWSKFLSVGKVSIIFILLFKL